MPESHEFIHYLLIVIGGAIAGFLNVLTGGGALISLPLLMGVGLPSTWANGTNRVVVIMQDIAALFKFAKNKKIPFRIALILGIATALGTLIGSFGAVHLNKNFLNYVIFCIIIPVRHKMLDAIGDLFMCGHNIIGAFTAFKSDRKSVV